METLGDCKLFRCIHSSNQFIKSRRAGPLQRPNTQPGGPFPGAVPTVFQNKLGSGRAMTHAAAHGAQLSLVASQFIPFNPIPSHLNCRSNIALAARSPTRNRAHSGVHSFPYTLLSDLPPWRQQLQQPASRSSTLTSSARAGPQHPRLLDHPVASRTPPQPRPSFAASMLLPSQRPPRAGRLPLQSAPGRP